MIKGQEVVRIEHPLTTFSGDPKNYKYAHPPTLDSRGWNAAVRVSSCPQASTRDAAGSKSMTSPDSYEQLFVVGAPRSGTTYLSGLLEDTRFGTPIEPHFITKYHDRLDRYGDLQQAANFAHLIRDISRERPVMQWQLDLDADLIRA